MENRFSKLKVGDTVWCSCLEFGRSINGCRTNIKPTELTITESGGKRLLQFYGRFCLRLDEMSDKGLDSYGVYLTKEEAVDNYNASVLNELDRLENFYEDTRKRLTKRMLKKC